SHSLCFKPSRRPKDRVAVNILEHVATCCSFFEGRSWEACLAPFRPWRLHMLSGIGQQAASMNLPQEEYQPHHRSPGPTFNRNQLQEAREKYPLQERRHRPCRLCLVHTVGPDVHPSRCGPPLGRPRMSLSHEGEMSPLSKSHSSSAVHERDEREHVRERMLSGEPSPLSMAHSKEDHVRKFFHNESSP
ncbi:unnamed protein product, partial [Durusdinium trenchii]